MLWPKMGRRLVLATRVVVAVTLLQAALHCQATAEGADAPGAIQMTPLFVANESTGEILSSPAVATKQGYVVVVAMSTTGQSAQILRRTSVDGGKTFNATDRVCVGCAKAESSLILLGERESADFLLVFLDSTGNPSVARSHDNGETWFAATRMDLDAPWIPGTARCQLASGLIVLGGKSPAGAPLIATSANLGISWIVSGASSMLGAVFALPASGTTRFASPQPCAGPSCPFGTAHATLQLPATRWGNAVFAAKVGNASRQLNILVSTDDGKSFEAIEQVVTSQEVSGMDLAVLPLASNRTGCLVADVLASGCGADAHLSSVLVVAGSPNDVSIAMLPPQHDLCPAGCSGHGTCIQASCECDGGWAPPDCSNQTTDEHSFLKLTHEYASAAPNNATTVTNGNVRVQLLTEDLARLEYSPTQTFVDAPSVAVLKRAWPSVEHKVETLDGWLSITTSGLKIEYNIASPGPFNRNNTRVTVRAHGGKDSMTWHPDQPDDHNLGGIPQFPYDLAIYDPLDHGETNTTGQDGLLSHAGYTVLDDSFTPIYNSAADWIEARPGVVASPNSSMCAVSSSDRSECVPQLGLGRDCTNGPNQTCGNPPNPAFCASMGCCYDPSQTPMCYFSQLAPRDMFFFGYGSSDQPDYKKALQLASALLGPPPLPPKHALGVWVGDRAGYSIEEWRSIVQRYREEELPIDMIVLDSDSSTKATWSRGSWDTEQLPDPAGMWQWLHSEHVVATVNEHFAAIDRDTTHQFEAIRQRVGLPSGTAAINHDLANKSYAIAWAEQLHLDDLRQGLGFWWEDGNAGANMVGLDAMTWTRHVEYALHSELARTGSALRPWTFCRGGSWGSHRYGSVFTGDLSSAWDKLLQVVIASIRSGNALVPYLANDDLGVMGPEALSDNEYHRWIQFASLSAHYWTHPMWGDRFPYDYGDAGLRVFRKFLELRMHLMPYMYSLAHEAHTSGVSLLRGMYIEFPQHSESYIPCTGIRCTHVGVNATTYGAASSVGGLISNGGFEAVTADGGHMAPTGWVPYLSGSTTQNISRAVVHSGNFAAELKFNPGPEGLLAILQNCGPATTPSCAGASIKADVSYEYSFWAYCTLAPCTFRTEWLTQPQGRAQTFPLLASDSNPTKFHTVAAPHVWTRFTHQVTSAADQGAVVIDLGLCSSSGCTPAANPTGVIAYVDDIILAEVSCSTNQCQYMLGPSLLVAPVTDTLPEDGSFNVKTVWLPPGSEWCLPHSTILLRTGRLFIGTLCPFERRISPTGAGTTSFNPRASLRGTRRCRTQHHSTRCHCLSREARFCQWLGRRSPRGISPES